METLLTILIIGIVIAIPGTFIMLRDAIKNTNEKRQYLKDHPNLAEENFYKECRKAGLTEIVSEADFRRADLISQKNSLQYYTRQEITDAFDIGKKIVEAEEEKQRGEEKKKKLADMKADERKIQAQCEEYLSFFGKEKTLAYLRKKSDSANKAYASASSLYDSVYQTGGATLMQKEASWGLAGGVASAIAGPAAGVAAAMDVQQKNEQIRAHNAQMSNLVNSSRSYASNRVRSLKSTANHLIHCLEKAELALIEEKPIDELFKQLIITQKEKTVSESGSVIMTATVDKAQLKIYDTVDAFIDGSFKAQLMKDNKVVGEVNFVFPYRGTMEKTEIKGICTSTTEYPAEYKVKFVPNHLWAMENLPKESY